MFRLRPIVNPHRASLLLPSKQLAVLPTQRRFASGLSTSISDDVAAEEQNLPESPHDQPAIDSATSEEAIATQSASAEETIKAESPAIDASGSFSPTSTTLGKSRAMHQDISQEIATAEAAAVNEAISSAGAGAGAAGSAVPGSASFAAREPALNIEPNTTLYVGNLYFEVSEDALQEQFVPYGKITRVRIVYDHRGLSKGFGYVEFENVQGATAAIQALDQQLFGGRRMAVQYHRKKVNDLTRTRQPNNPSKTLFIGNMSFEMSDKDLNDLFREVRNVVDVRVAIDRRTGQPRGFAHADFMDVESATKAKEYLESKEVYGRKLRVDFGKSATRTPSE